MTVQMARNPTFPLYDRMLGGRLNDILARWRAEGVAAAEMAFRLREQHGIRVSAETVRRWLRKLPESTEALS